MIVAALTAACDAKAPVQASRAPIVDGVLGGDDAVVMIFRGNILCTGAIIAPRVILTANHCVEDLDTRITFGPESFEVFIGASRAEAERAFDVESVRPVPDAGLGSTTRRVPNDVALLVLSEPAEVAPFSLAREPSTTLRDAIITAVGYGQTPDDRLAVKFTTRSAVTDVEDGFVFVEPTICHGDSGGPLLDSRGRVYGVASFIFSREGPVGDCGEAPGAYNETFRHLDFIDEVIESVHPACDGPERCNGQDDDCDARIDEGLSVGAACDGSDRDQCQEGVIVCNGAGEAVCDDVSPDNPETCNGVDDNCDGAIDEVCIDVGGACESAADCPGGRCLMTGEGRRCAAACDPTRPALGCDVGFYCAMTDGCTGYCVRGEAGALGYGDACEVDSDCVSLRCVDPDGAGKRCVDVCQFGAGQCLDGEICGGATEAGCGVCLSEASTPRALGDRCGVDSDCQSQICLVREGLGECTTACAGSCPAGFLCRASPTRVPKSATEAQLCVRVRERGFGHTCGDRFDCQSGICARQGVRTWCTKLCEADIDCPEGSGCVAAAGRTVCDARLALEGEVCASDAACHSGLCGAHGQCTQSCGRDERCGPGFVCRRGGDAHACVPVEGSAPPAGGGCAVTGGASGSAYGLWPLICLALSRLRRRQAVANS